MLAPAERFTTPSFPSPQGGSETESGEEVMIVAREVSIPSRRVGDLMELQGQKIDAISFHPLKAGRRLFLRLRLPNNCYGFHPLKAGRRHR